MKTLVTILNFELPDFTDNLYDQLTPYKGDLYDIEVIDNGSKEEKRSKYTTLQLNENIYFGGALASTVDYFLNDSQYDSLLFLNNDLNLHGYNYVKELRKTLFENDNVGIVTSCVLGFNSQNECYWPQMRNWGSKELRIVDWVDFQCPLIKREVLENIKQYPQELWPGYGYDIYSAMTCKELNCKIGVCDWLPVVHYGEATLKLAKPSMEKNLYFQTAMNNMYSYFDKIGKLKELEELRNNALKYSYE